MTGIRLRLLQPAWHPSFIDLPWDQPLESWEHHRLVNAPTGIHRHVVRFVDYDGQVYVLKELARRPALKEFTMLRRLNELGLPVVRMIGIVERPDLDPIVITRFLNHALPYRYVLSDPSGIGRPEEVVRSVAALLAQLHVTGFSWGDCSLSNSMVRRDAGQLSAYALDTETGEMHDRLTPGQRTADLEVAYENVAGGLADLAASGALDADPFELADRFIAEYERVWTDISRDRLLESSGSIPLEDLHDLGFDVLEAVVTLDDAGARLTPVTIGEGHFRWELHRLTGLVTRERQAQLLIDEIRSLAPDLDVDLAAHRWLTEVFDPILTAVSPAHRTKLEPAEMVIEVLGHRHRRAGEGVQLSPAEAAREYSAVHLQQRPDERVVVEE